MIRNYALLITLPLSIVLYMLLYFVPVVSVPSSVYHLLNSPCSCCSGPRTIKCTCSTWSRSSPRCVPSPSCSANICKSLLVADTPPSSMKQCPSCRNKTPSYWSIYTIFYLHGLVLVVVQNGHSFAPSFFFRHARQCHSATATAEQTGRDTYRDRYQHHARGGNHQHHDHEGAVRQ